MNLFSDNVKSIFQHALEDPSFREELFAGPEQALATYTLSSEEYEALRKLQLTDLYAYVGRQATSLLLPIRAGKHLVIVPPWLNVFLLPDDKLIRLDQQKTAAGIDRSGRPVALDGSAVSSESPLAFGSGLHPTTCMCLEALEECLADGHKVLDVGTGSGILAIAAARLGAGKVLALDIDSAAVKVAREHVALNQVENIVQVELGSVDYLHGSPFGASIKVNLIVANLILSGIQAVMKEGLAEFLYPGGKLVFSGFRSAELAEVLQVIDVAGLVVDCQKQQDDWCAIICQRTPQTS